MLLRLQIAFERGDLTFVLNFHPTNSYTKYLVGMRLPGEYQIVLDTDWTEFGGHNRNDRSVHFPSSGEPAWGRPDSIRVYAPSRSAQVYKRIEPVSHDRDELSQP